MKARVLIMMMVTTVSIVGQEKEPKVKFTAPSPAAVNTPTNTPSGSAIARTKELSSFDLIMEPKLSKSLCTNSCICVECLNKASCELEKIKHKLPYLQILIKSPKSEQDEKLNMGAAGPQAIAAARMIANLKKVARESKELDLLLKKAKDKSKSEKKSKKDKKESKPKALNLSASSRSQRLTTSSDNAVEEEFNQLTDPKQDNIKWRLKHAGSDLI